MGKYNYPDRELFESILNDNGYAPVTIQVYASGVCNPSATAYDQAVALWDKYMDGLPRPVWDELISSPNRPTGLTYAKGERKSPEPITPKAPEPEVTPVTEDVKEKNEGSDLDFIRLVLKHSKAVQAILDMPVDDDLKRRFITVLFEE